MPDALRKLTDSRSNQLDRRTFTPARRAALALSLPGDFTPTTNFRLLFKGVPGGHHGVMERLRGTTDATLRPVMDLYEQLAPAERRGVTIDLLMAAAKVTDPHAVLGAVTAELSRAQSHMASILVALAAPDIVRHSIENAAVAGIRGHADRKMLLQAAGAAPVPKSSVTNITARIDSRTQTNVLVEAPRLEDIVRQVSQTTIVDDEGVVE